MKTAGQHFMMLMPIHQSTNYSLIIFFIAQIMTIIFVAFLYFRQHRREFAVARALGIPAGHGIFCHILPTAFLSVVGIGTGSEIGWNYSTGKVQETLKTLVGDANNIEIELSSLIPVLLTVVFLILLVLTVCLHFVVLSRNPILEILQECPQNRRPKNAGVVDYVIKKEKETITGKKIAFSQPGVTEQLEASVSGNGKPVIRSIIVRHIFRSRSSTVLVLIVAVVFIFTLGWISQSIRHTSRNVEKLYENISVDAQILKRNSRSVVVKPVYIAGSVVDAIIDTGYVKKSRLAAVSVDAHLWDVEENDRFSTFTLCGITGMDTLTVEEAPGVLYSFEKSEVIYADGWDDSLFSMEYPMEEETYPIVVPESIMDRFQVNLGDRLLIEADSRQATALIAGMYTGEFINLNSLRGDMVLMPHCLMQRLHKGSLSYEIAEFTLDPRMNRDLQMFREEVKKIVENDYQSQCPITLKIWDEELRKVVEPMEQNLRLMKILYPIAQLVVMLAGGMVSLLLLLQNAMTAAILRVLGIPAKNVRRMLGAEQIVLGVGGILAGILLCVILNKWNIGLLVSVALYLVGLLIGTGIGSVAVTRKKPLELLQVKE